MALLSPDRLEELGRRVAAVEEWSVDQGLQLHSIRGHPYADCGAGVIALEDIGPDHLLAEVPECLIVCTRMARQSPHLAPFLRAVPLSPIDTICLFLLLERCLGEEATLRPWIEVLPRHFDNLLHFGPDEVAALQNRKRISKVLREQDQARHSWTALRDALGGHLASDASSILQLVLDKLSWENFLWAYSCLMSRGFFFDVDSSAGDVWAMMPWADFFNYSPEGDNVQMEMKGTSFCFRSTARWQRGEQVLLKYGAYSNFELLLWYGFTLPQCCRYPLTPLQGPSGECDDPTTGWMARLLTAVRQTARQNPEWVLALQYAEDWPGRIACLADQGWHKDWWIGLGCISRRLATAIRVLTLPSSSMASLIRQPSLSSFNVPPLMLLKAICHQELAGFSEPPVSNGEVSDPVHVAAAQNLAREERAVLQKVIDGSLKELRSFRVSDG
eukprot:GGOE01061834.1.p1 GENE.GGOE01061834.1~~GGOE01061834.1.p1  ORF type:complete len:444 (+),score=127.66 GGOE01061834.1:90-1421(+)